MNQKLLKPKDIAERLNISIPQVYLMQRKGEIPVVRIGRCVRVREEDVEKFILNHLEHNNKNQTSASTVWSGIQDLPSHIKDQSHV